ncbi:MAG: transporter ATP-binding protein [Candidatus Parcubacteria bacterium]|nr:transporter ATP-binding protein [Candidatus Parcubacteria bacterium]
MSPKPSPKTPKSSSSMFGMLRQYWKFSALLAGATIIGNSLGLFVPKFISWGIDMYSRGEPITETFYIEFLALSFGIFLLTYFQGVFQTYLSEKAAFDIRENIADKISGMTYARLESETPAKLLTNLTSDIDAVKVFLSMGFATIISSVVVIVGAATLLVRIDWRLALMVLTILPVIGLMFFFVFKKLGPLFKRSQELVDGFNLVISESVIGSAIVRVFDSGELEHAKFSAKNTAAKDTGMSILKMFSLVIPTIGAVANVASLVILAVGGGYVISGSMTIGDFTAFNSYVFILIFPIIMLGFVSNIISRAQTSYNRIKEVLNLPDEKEAGTYEHEIRGDVDVKNVSLIYGERKVLDEVSFSIRAKTRMAIIGPTAAGKTQLLQVLMGLTDPKSGEVFYDGKPLKEYAKQALYSQIALVFQDSVLFNMSLRENIGFSATVKDEYISKAIETAELGDFIHTLPKGLDTIVSERGTSLSGGQKQRIMLARALALNPKVLLLDDFTARVDTATERTILSNIEKNYPDITIISVTQKIRSVEHFDKIILLMEGELIAEGTHAELSKTSPEYAQIMESQKSTQAYEN